MKSTGVKLAEKARVISRKSEYGGLCMTCEHAPTCIYPRDLDRPVWQCEEFEVNEAPLEKTTVGSFLAEARAKARPGIDENEEAKFKGLCLNCENRKTCIFPKPEEGVWRCEEYE